MTQPRFLPLVLAAALAANALAPAVATEKPLAPYTVVESGRSYVRLQDAVNAIGNGKGTIRFASMRFADCAVQSRRIGDSHLRLTFGDGMGAKLEAVAFGAFDGPLGPALDNPGHQRFHLAGKLELNHYGGRTKVQLRLDDAARA